MTKIPPFAVCYRCRATVNEHRCGCCGSKFCVHHGRFIKIEAPNGEDISEETCFKCIEKGKKLDEFLALIYKE